MKKIILTIAFACLICVARGGDKLVVHEWGTFTSLQDEEGNAIGGINVDDEPLPNFVHRLAYYLMLPPVAPPANGGSVAGFTLMSKGITPRCHPDVTMRLETPVLYFYPLAGWKPQSVDVDVKFQGGWLSEYYPDAIFKVPGFDSAHPDEAYSNEHGNKGFSGFGHIKPDAAGELSWKGLIIGEDGAGPETTEKVWLAPRDVKAAIVKTAGGEAEKFLFYRGVGNVNAPLRIVRDEAKKTLKAYDQRGSINMINPEENLRIPAAWLVQVRDDGSCAFKSLGKVEWTATTRAVLPGSFGAGDFAPENMPRLQAEMRGALINQGLFADEADALLNTWQVSYFKNPGIRFFYICPRHDVDAALPLKISVPTDVTRVMIGRIEIVSPEQRALLEKIASDPAPILGVANRTESGASRDDYLKLGRFRNALILDEFKHHPTPILGDFIQKNALEEYKFD